MSTTRIETVRADLRQATQAVPFQRPELPPLEAIAAYFDASRAARRFSNGGPCFRQLAERIGAMVGATATPVANATLALVLSLRAATTGRAASRREVIVPSFTFAASAAAVVWAGLEPVFADVDPAGWHLDPESLAGLLAARGERVAAVIGCSTFGTPPPREQLGAWVSLCRKANVALLVDSAAGFGANDEDGNLLGRQGDAEIFSFHATKPLAIGEGGAVTTVDPVLARRVASLANFGFAEDRELVECGINAKLDEWHAATALAALDDLPRVLAARAQRRGAILDELAGTGVTSQAGAERSTHQFVPLLVPDPARRGPVLAAAARCRVELRTYFDPPLHRTLPFGRCARGQLAVTEELASRCISLPMANDLAGDETAAIVASVRTGLAN